jgi:hypothetical protein
MTAQMKDEYKVVMKPDGKPEMDKYGNPITYKTGRRERDGFERMRYEADIRLFLELVEVRDEKTGAVRLERRARVVKNRFCSKTGKGWIPMLIGDEEVSWGGIIKLATVPKEQGGVGLTEAMLR